MLKRQSSRLPLWLVYSALVGVLFVGSFYVPRAEVFAPDALLEDSGAATLGLLQEMMKVVISLNTALFAAAAAVSIKGHEWSTRWGPAEASIVMLVFVCGSVSYFGIYIMHVRLLEMAAAGAISATETGVLWALRLQYYGVILGAALLGLVFTRMLEARRDFAATTGPTDEGAR